MSRGAVRGHVTNSFILKHQPEVGALAAQSGGLRSKGMLVRAMEGVLVLGERARTPSEHC